MTTITIQNHTISVDKQPFPYSPTGVFGAVDASLVLPPRQEWSKIDWKVVSASESSASTLYIIANIYNHADEIEVHVEYTFDTVRGLIDNCRFYPTNGLAAETNAGVPFPVDERESLRHDVRHYLLSLRAFWSKAYKRQNKKAK